MKKLLIFSDVHGYRDRYERILKVHADVDYRLSAGDSELEPSLLANHNVLAVYGNADQDAGQKKVILDVEGHTLVMVHGHEHRIHLGDHGMVKLLKKHQATFVIHGHTHVARLTLTSAGVIINPGAVSRSRGSLPASYALLTIKEGQYTMTWYDAQNDAILDSVEYSLKEL